MKLIFVISLILNSALIFGQNWSPVGAEWYYDKTYAMSGNIHYHRVYCDSVITVKGIDCQRIRIDYCACNNYFCSLVYTYERNDSIFIYSPDLDTFQLIYDFNALPGAEWKIYRKLHNGDLDTVLIHVDSTGTLNANGQVLKILYLTYNYNILHFGHYEVHSEVVEKLGDIAFVFNIMTENLFVCDMDFIGSLRCYEDSVFGHYSTGRRNSCTYTFQWISTHDIQKDVFRIYPNPTQNTLIIEHEYDNILYKIYDNSGVLRKKGNESIITMTELPNAVYFLKLIAGGNYTIKKIVKINP